MEIGRVARDSSKTILTICAGAEIGEHRKKSSSVQLDIDRRVTQAGSWQRFTRTAKRERRLWYPECNRPAHAQSSVIGCPFDSGYSSLHNFVKFPNSCALSRAGMNELQLSKAPCRRPGFALRDTFCTQMSLKAPEHGCRLDAALSAFAEVDQPTSTSLPGPSSSCPIWEFHEIMQTAVPGGKKASIASSARRRDQEPAAALPGQSQEQGGLNFGEHAVYICDIGVWFHPDYRREPPFDPGQALKRIEEPVQDGLPSTSICISVVWPREIIAEGPVRLGAGAWRDARWQTELRSCTRALGSRETIWSKTISTASVRPYALRISGRALFDSGQARGEE
ncbi:hypothetical protein DFH06DRAFT_1141273 [Mycena polygramma]|nr:hypothetical protein DFH06DRAFT_1141273 [Mycena polygramma]